MPKTQNKRKTPTPVKRVFLHAIRKKLKAENLLPEQSMDAAEAREDEARDDEAREGEKDLDRRRLSQQDFTANQGENNAVSDATLERNEKLNRGAEERSSVFSVNSYQDDTPNFSTFTDTHRDTHSTMAVDQSRDSGFSKAENIVLTLESRSKAPDLSSFSLPAARSFL